VGARLWEKSRTEGDFGEVRHDGGGTNSVKEGRRAAEACGCLGGSEGPQRSAGKKKRTTTIGVRGVG